MTRSSTLRYLLALLIVLGLVAAACGDDDDATGTDDTTTTTDDAGDGDDAGDTADGDDTADAGDAADGGTDATDGADDAADGGDADGADDMTDDAEAMEPQYGGEIVFGLEAETNTGWTPGSGQFAVSGHEVARAIFDPLTIADEEGNVHPFLAESLTPNDDFTVWEIKLRDGITFHDGSPLNADALLANTEFNKGSSILGPVLVALQSWEKVDDLTVRYTYDSPQSAVPAGLDGQVGYVVAPAQLEDDDGKNNPIGTGPFMFESWNPGESLTVVRNPNYWRTDAEGRELPFLDKVVFRPIPDKDARKNAFEAGDLDVNHSSFNEDRPFWQDNYRNAPEGSRLETTYLMINAAAPPMDDVRVRRGLAMCTNYDQYLQLRAPNAERANGPFSPGVPGYLDDTGYPDFDPDGGRALLEEAAADGVDLSGLTYGTTPVPANKITADLITQMWSDNCGVDAAIEQIEQGEFITIALLGDFQVFLWRNHAEISPSNEFVWWHSDHSGPIGGLAVANFGRIEDPAIDAGLEGVRATDDPAGQQAAAEDVNRAFAEGVYNIWLNWTTWDVPMQDNVHGVGSTNIPDVNMPSIANQKGRVWLTEAWVEQ